MDQLHHPHVQAHRANSDATVFPGLVGLTEPFTELVSGAIASLSAMRSRMREDTNRRRTLDALNRLPARLLADVGLQPSDLTDVAKRHLPLEELERRRTAHGKGQRSRLDSAVKSRRPAANDEKFSLVA